MTPTLRRATAACCAALLLGSGAADAKPLPNAPAMPAGLQQQLQQALAAQGPDYRPRTEHLDQQGRPHYLNRLIGEDSPYLLQHAHNPVDWYPWGPAAFAAARRANKPIFLSIGYSTCHWCHVMEKESFEDLKVARRLNRDFIAIKVDRERRPDVDEVYMTAVRLVSGTGGWPMSSFLTPDGKPFYGETYIPRDRFVDLLGRVAEVWRDDPQTLHSDAERLAAQVQWQLSVREKGAVLTDEAVRRARDRLLASRDDFGGGIGGAPKFPHEPELLFLLDQARRHQDSAALTLVTEALGAMADGGIHDQVGGGFHRYATTPDWLIPHFEQMLYNQAQLAQAYRIAWMVTGDPATLRTVRRLLNYVLRDLSAADGTFWSASDADSDGHEGRFFLWTPAQIRDALEPRDADLVIDLFAVTEAGDFDGANILHLPQSLADYARTRRLDPDRLTRRVDHALAVLYQVRRQRVHPARDRKRITAWNGMMIAALADAGRTLQQPGYLTAAERATDAILADRGGDGELWRVKLGTRSSVPGKLDDYAWMVTALLALFDAGRDPARLRQAEDLADRMLGRFGNPEARNPAAAAAGGLYRSAAGGDPLFVRPKQAGDGALPSANSAALLALARLAARSDNPTYRAAADALLGAFAQQVQRRPTGYPFMLLAAEQLRHGETGPLRYAAAGHLRVDAALERPAAGAATLLRLDLALSPGWHINSPAPRQPDLVATRVTPAQGSAVAFGPTRWPPPVERRLGFVDRPLTLFEGNITGRTPLAGNGPVLAELHLQACSDRVCLPPETVRLQPARTLAR